MSLGLDKHCINILVDLTKICLDDVDIEDNNNVFALKLIDLYSADKVIPQNGKIREELDEIIGNQPYINFVIEFMDLLIKEKRPYKSKVSNIKLIDIYPDTEKLAKLIAKKFNSLPWSYKVSFELKKNMGKSIDDYIDIYEISQGIRLFKPNEDILNSFPTDSEIINNRGSFTRLLKMSNNWKKESLYFQVEQRGFIGIDDRNNTIRNAKSQLKSFIGLGLALRLFYISPLSSNKEYRNGCLIHRKDAEKWKLIDITVLDEDLNNTIKSLRLNSSLIEPNNINSTKNNIIETLKKISTAFKKESKLSKIILASEWYYNTGISENELINFIQSTIVLEILLGDKSSSDIIGIGELLSNRCAYLIGESNKDRNEIIKKFKKIYDIRSKIVHSGKSKINSSDKEYLDDLRNIIERLFFKEISLLEMDEMEVKRS